MNKKELVSSVWAAALLLTTSALAQEAALQVKERGAHHRVVENLVSSFNEQGQPITVTNTYTDLEIGLHYQNEQGGWVEASDELEIIDGKAIGNKALHQVAFEPNLATPGAITLVTPEGQILRSHILGLSYFDPTTGQSVLIAEIKDTIGEVHGRNQVIYHDAFDDVAADVRYTFTKAGFEQDVILRAAPPAPEEFGLNPETVQLQVLTEFIQPPAPQQRQSLITGLTAQRSGQALSAVQDVELDFGSMRIGTGKAFSTEDDVMDGSLPSTRGVGVPVGKEWTKLEGRDFLIESVSYPTVQTQVEALPTNTKEEASIQNIKTRRVVSNARKLPVREASAGLGGSIKAVQASVTKRPGLVIDYATVSTLATPYTFQGDSTYHVTGDFTLSGAVTLEGGAVIKYNANAQIRITGTFVCLTAPYRPAIFTAKDDNTVGENISGSTGSPSGYYASSALYFGIASNLENVQFRHCNQAVYYHDGVAASTLRHAQLVKCNNGIETKNVKLDVRNVLMEDVVTCFTGTRTPNPVIGVEHLTVFQTGATTSTMTGSVATIVVSVTNSLLAGLTSTANFNKTSTETPASSSGLFFTAGAGKGYLASGTYRNKGMLGINPELLKDIRQKTTYPPTVLSAMTISTPTLCAPVVQRDTDLPDLGYHYDPIDYAVTAITINNTTLVLTNGVAIAVYGDFGFIFQSGAKLISEGTPFQLNRIVRYPSVQGSSSQWGANGYIKAIMRCDVNPSIQPQARFRFTEISIISLGANHKHIFSSAYSFNPLAFTDCQLHAGKISVWATSDTSRTSYFNLTNNLIERLNIDVYHNDPTYSAKSTAYIYNNLFWRTTALFHDNYGGSPNTPKMTIKDNVFDNCTLSTGGYAPASSYNGYINTSALYGTGGNDETTASFTYQNGSLGRYYHSSTTFVDQGSRTSAQAGLYHYTTKANQAKELSTQVDIGYHYPAVGPSNESLVGHWKLDETTGTMASDQSAYQQHGKLVNAPTWTTGKMGNGVNFSSGVAGDHVMIPPSPYLSFPNDNFTISIWVKPSSGTAVLGKGDGGQVVSTEYLLLVNGSGFFFRGSWRTSTALNSLPLNTWSHVVVVYDNGTLRYYRDGVLHTTTAITGAYATDTSYGLYFGQQGAGAYNPYSGVLDDVRIYRRALGESEILALANTVSHDSDNDGLWDLSEDKDGDGVVDTGESSFSNYDSDGDGMSDGQEYLLGTSPISSTVTPALQYVSFSLCPIQ